MEPEYTRDSVVREAIEQTGVRDFERTFSFRKIYTESRRLGAMPSPRVEGKIEYGFVTEDQTKVLTIIGNCVSGTGIRRKNAPENLMIGKDVDKYRAARERNNTQENVHDEEELAAGENNNPITKGNMFFRDVGRLVQRRSIKGPPGQYGVLVDSYKDREWYTAQLGSILIQYVHPDAIMNIDKHIKTTDLTGEALLKVMEKLKAQYNVNTGYFNGKERGRYAPAGGIGGDPRYLGPEADEKQNNVFLTEFRGAATVDEITSAIKNVHAAGEAWRAGIYTLREQRAQEETKRNQDTLDRLVGAF